MRSRAIQLLSDFVAIPSVNPMGRTDQDVAITGERRYAEHVAALLARMHVDCVTVGQGERLSVIGELRTQQALDTVLVASHLDTVPVDGMTIAPFDPRIEADRLYGRGSCDTKGGLAALLAALERVLAQGTLRRNLLVVGEADEEAGSQGVADVLTHLGGRKADWVLATEPTSMRLVTAHKGRATIEVRAQGVAVHSSDPDRGQNAIAALSRAVLALEALHLSLRSRAHPLLGPPTLAVSLIGGGQASNIVPHEAWLIADRRLVPGDDAASVRAEIEAALSAAGLDGQVRVDRVELGKDSLFTSPDQPAVRACQRSLSACALEPAITFAAFATDAGPLQAAGMPGVVLGPGDIADAHTAAESVPVAEVEAMQRFYERLLSG
jgi:acetylornithine deacetylase